MLVRFVAVAAALFALSAMADWKHENTTNQWLAYSPIEGSSTSTELADDSPSPDEVDEIDEVEEESLLSEYYEIKPKWQVGIAAFSLYFPHYPASNHFYRRLFPIPIFIYRLSDYKLRDSNLSFRHQSNTELSFSWGVRLPVEGGPEDSSHYPSDVDNPKKQIVDDDNYHRRGMKDLSWIFKPGFGIKHRLNDHLSVQLNSFVNLAIQDEFNYEGFEINPGIDYHLLPFYNKYNVKAAIKFSYGDEKLNQYYYQVNSAEAIEGRPQYDAKSGEIGRAFALTFTYDYQDKFKAFAFIDWQDYSHSANRQSPLYISNQQQVYAIGIFYYIFSSEKRVKMPMDL